MHCFFSNTVITNKILPLQMYYIRKVEEHAERQKLLGAEEKFWPHKFICK
jgi:hypothetical protein